MEIPSHTAPHEVEEGVSLDDTGGPLENVTFCDKNIETPGHHDSFIKIKQLKKESFGILPGDIPASLALGLVKSLVPSVVRIHGKYVSQNRPETWQDDNRPYLFAERKGAPLDTVGSGFIVDVDRSDERSVVTCQHPAWKVYLLTARHVVFDEDEAQQCEVALFDNRDSGRGVVKLTGWNVTRADTGRDSCIMECRTSDKKVVDKLKAAKRQQHAMAQKILKMRSAARYSVAAPVVCISHPHGRQKYVSIGELSGWEEDYVIFSTPTCGGCSGGAIVDLNDLTLSVAVNPHRGAKYDTLWAEWKIAPAVHTHVPKNRQDSASTSG